jgi:putative ABC transport system permease protein
MRKVLGADRARLIRQFLGEAVLTVALAALLGLILAELGLPLINAAGGLSLSIPYMLVVPGLVVLALVVGVAAGPIRRCCSRAFPPPRCWPRPARRAAGAAATGCVKLWSCSNSVWLPLS